MTDQHSAGKHLPPHEVEVPTAVLQAATQAAIAAITEYANHGGATVGSQRQVIDALNQMAGVGRIDLATRIASVAVAAAHLAELNAGESTPTLSTPECSVCNDQPKPDHYCADCGRQA